jgi:serine/threonine-protein kinase
VKVCDFGIAKFIEDRADRSAPATGDEKLTKAGIVMGTPEYMSPEQCRGDPLDVRSDLYSMGVILYQLVTGRVPFEAETALAIVLKQINEDAPRPRTVNPDADARLAAVCLKALSKKREQRYQTAREMRADLRAVVGTWAPGPESSQSLPMLPDTPDLPDAPDIPSMTPTKPGLARQTDRTQRMRPREAPGPQVTQRMKAREETGPTGTVLMKARQGRGPTGTVLMKAFGGGPGSGRARVWLVMAAALGVLALVLTAWAFARR